MWQALKDTVIELLGSKKFLVLLSSVIAWLLLKLGWNVDQAVIDHYLELAGAFILAQGIADHGKGAAEVQARALHGDDPTEKLALPLPPPPPVRTPQAGRVRIGALVATALSGIAVALGATALLLCGGCAGAQKWSGDFVTCAKADLGVAVGSNGPSLLADIAQLIEGNAATLEGDLTALAIQFGIDAVDCAIAATVTVLDSQPAGSGSAVARREIPPGAQRAVTWAVHYRKARR